MHHRYSLGVIITKPRVRVLILGENTYNPFGERSRGFGRRKVFSPKLSEQECVDLSSVLLAGTETK
jgi:hypothetical protein